MHRYVFKRLVSLICAVWIGLGFASQGYAHSGGEQCPPEIPGLGRLLLKRLPWREVVKTRLRAGDPNSIQVVQAMNSPRWWQTAPFQKSWYSQAGVLRAALAAVEIGKLAPEQLASLILQWSVLEDYPVQRMHFEPMLKRNGTLTDNAREFFFGQWATLSNQMFGGEGHGAPPEVIRTFEGLIRVLPPSERFIGIAKFPHADVSKYEGNPQHMHMLEEMMAIAEAYREGEAGDQPFETMRVALDPKFGEENKTTVVTFTSFSAYQAFLYAVKSPESHITLYPVIGISSRHEMLELIEQHGGRDAPLTFPEVQPRVELDGVYRGRHGTFVHAFEQALDPMTSGMPRTVYNIIPRTYRLLDRFVFASHVQPEIAVLGKVRPSEVQLNMVDLQFGGVPGSSLAQWIKWMVQEEKVFFRPAPDEKEGKMGLSALAWVVVDMAKHPLVYEAAGFNIDEIIPALGKDAASLFRAIRFNDSPDALPLYKDAWEIYRWID